jgi:glycosyltransferase involved in cell wall biosynthesis
VAVSQAVGDALVAEGVSAHRLAVVPNGVSLERLRVEATLPNAEIPAERPLVAAVGRLAPVKGMEELIRAAVLVPQATFAILGEGRLKSSLQELASALQVSKRVRFLGKSVRPASLMSLADVVAVPSRSEGFGLVAAEAAALGRPVVAARVGGLSEIVEDGVTGLLVSPGNVEELAAAPSRASQRSDTRTRDGGARARAV